MARSGLAMGAGSGVVLCSVSSGEESRPCIIRVPASNAGACESPCRAIRADSVGIEAAARCAGAMVENIPSLKRFSRRAVSIVCAGWVTSLLCLPESGRASTTWPPWLRLEMFGLMKPPPQKKEKSGGGPRLARWPAVLGRHGRRSASGPVSHGMGAGRAHRGLEGMSMRRSCCGPAGGLGRPRRRLQTMGAGQSWRPTARAGHAPGPPSHSTLARRQGARQARL